MKYLFTAWLAFSMSTWAGTRPAQDGYVFQQKEFQILDLEIKVVLLENQQQLTAAAAEYGLDARPSNRFDLMRGQRKAVVVAFSVLEPGLNRCTLFVKDPDWSYDPASMGHELAHCIWGRWHPDH